MTDLSKATPRPWHGDPEGYAEFIWGPNNEMIAEMRGAGYDLDQLAHRDLILEAVNSHDRLLRVEKLAGDLAKTVAEAAPHLMVVSHRADLYDRLITQGGELLAEIGKVTP